MDKSLKDRFQTFMASLSYVELIDNINIAPSISGKDPQRADYFWFERQIIVELKTLETDTSSKVHKELDKHKDHDDYPLFYGEVEFQNILRHLQDGEEINRRIYRNITRSIEDNIRSTNKQINDTKTIFNLYDSIGILIMLNENIRIMSPNIITHRVSELLTRTDPNGSPHYSNIVYSWLIFESHYSTVKNGVRGLPSILLKGPAARSQDGFSTLFEKIQREWARYNGIPLIQINVEKISSINFHENCPKRKQNEKGITRQEFWIKMYRECPYMRGLSDKAVLEYGARSIETLAPYFLKGGPRVPMEEQEKMMVPFSDFLEEAQYRGLDLKDLPINRQVIIAQALKM